MASQSHRISNVFAFCSRRGWLVELFCCNVVAIACRDFCLTSVLFLFRFLFPCCWLALAKTGRLVTIRKPTEGIGKRDR